MNILETSLGRYAPGIINVVIEVPKGSKKKYRYHRKKRAFVVDYRLMIPPPTEYGWAPQTLTPVGKRLDVMLFVRKPSWAGNICEARPVGALKRYDRDHKLICVLLGEPRFETIHDISDLDGSTLKKIVQFFEPFFPVQGWMNRPEAIAFLEEVHRNYLEKARLNQIPASFEYHDEEEDFPAEFEGDDDAENPVEPASSLRRSNARIRTPGETVLSEVPTDHEA